MSTLEQHFRALDSDRDHPDYGPPVEREILAPWAHDAATWGPAYVSRVPGGLNIYAVLEGDGSPDQPFMQLPATMSEFYGEVTIDWRSTVRTRVDDDGYVYAERL